MRKNTMFIISLFVLVSCDDKFYKDKYDVEFSFINATDTTISELTIDAVNGAKIWTFNNIQPGKNETVTFNIKRDLKTPEGGFTMTAIVKDDSVSLNTGYFTNWIYQNNNPTKFNIYRDRIEELK